MTRAAALAAFALLGACATGGSVPLALPANGYLDAATIDDLTASFTPTPVDLRWIEADMPGKGPGTDRWWLATAQAELRPPEAAQHFDCVLGARLTEKPRPALTRLMGRLMLDADAATQRLAEQHPRRRPIAVDPSLRPCQRVNDVMRASPSWPAGGAVVGAAYGELFAALAPDAAQASRIRGADIGFSRAVCRMNWRGDVDDGAAVGKAVYQRSSLTPGFAADLQAARAEVTAARAEGLTNPACAAERLALRRSGY